MRKLTFALAFFFLLLLPAQGQTFNMEQDRVQMAELKGLWRFHTGDDPRWVDPSFDDSQWALLQSDQSWSEQVYKNYGGMAWYRFSVILPAKHGPMAFYVPYILTSYQVFANGRLIGQYGGLPPHPRVDWGAFSQVFSIPSELIPAGSTLQIAIRVWHRPYWAMFNGGGPLAASRCVPEATNEKGNLYGFDRVQELVRTQPTARQIAEAAQAFGQDDDISVISVARIPVAELALT